MTTTAAVATKPQPTTQTAISAPGKAQSPQALIAQGLDQIGGQLLTALPQHITVDRFKRVVMTAVNMTPALASADRRSLFNACIKCATDGLVPDGREAALVTFGNQCAYMPMVFGIIKKLRQSGEIASISARLVFENELKAGLFKFAIEDGQEKLSHQPMLMGERGRVALAYATARFKDGTVQNEVMTFADIEKVRNVSRSKDRGPWKDWWDEMARKTVVRRLSKYLPLSAEDMRVFEADHEASEFDALREAAKTAGPQSIGHAAAALSAPNAGDGETADAETGEIIDSDGQNADTPSEDAGPGTEEDRPIITRIPCPEIDGNAHWRGWADTARNAIPLLEPGHVTAWRAAHADELAGLAAVSKKLLAEVEADLAAKAKEAA
jgi:recombination protein RecT